ncbi:MAG TPA: YIP1 family protein [Anaeromyxobacteraceae bacterium]|nr:YIP1 family protein [Anaeromyxobacteraceae bacterium]
MLMPVTMQRRASAPALLLEGVVARRLAWPPLLAATLGALLFAAVAVPRTDFERAAVEALAKSGAGDQQSPHDREVALDTARRVGTLGAYAGAGLGTPLAALFLAVALWLGFQVAGGRPDFRGSLTVASLGLIPGVAEQLLSVPALLVRGQVPPWALDRLLPAGPGALLPPGDRTPLAALLWSIDLFSIAAVALVAWGMARVASVSPRRALLTTAVLWLGYVAVFRVAPAAFGGTH